MKVRTHVGKKGERDRYVEIKTEGYSGWERIDSTDIRDLLEHIFINEDIIYPRPKYKGSGMFMDEIIKCYAKCINGKIKSSKQ